MKAIPATSLVNQLVGCTLGLLVFSGSLGLGAVWARRGISETANRSRSLEVKIADIERRIDEVNADVAAAVNPEALRARNETMHLALETPREIQVQRVNQSPEDYLASKRNREIFAVGSTTGAFNDASAVAVPVKSAQPTFRIVTASLR